MSTSKAKIVIGSGDKTYIEFCSTMALQQQIKAPIRVKCNGFTLIDHILSGCSKKVVQACTIKKSYFLHQRRQERKI